MNPPCLIRKLVPTDLDEYIRLRREGVRLDPVGFGKASTTEDRVSRWLYASFLIPSETRKIWGAFCDESLVGMVRLEMEENGTRISLYSLYVCPEKRGGGIGRKLLDRAIYEAARFPMVAEVRLNVITTNEHALALYRSVGFNPCGIDKDTFRVGGTFYSEYRMRKFLHPPKIRPRLGALTRASANFRFASALTAPNSAELRIAA